MLITKMGPLVNFEVVVINLNVSTAKFYIFSRKKNYVSLHTIEKNH